MRTSLARVRWARLTPLQRRILVSHRPEPIEEDEVARRETLLALEIVFGPREYVPGDAVVDEGECDRSECRRPVPDGMTLREIGDRLGICVERTRQIQDRALRKMRHRLLGEESACATRVIARRAFCRP